MTARSQGVIRILLVDDDEVDRMAVRRALAGTDLRAEVIEAFDVVSARQRLSEQDFDCLLVDYYLPGGDGTDVIKAVAGTDAEAPVIVLTGRGGERLAVDLMKGGATDYINKGTLTTATLAASVRGAMRVARAERAERSARAEIERQGRQRERLAAAGIRIHAARSLVEMLEIAAAEARVLVDAQAAEVHVETPGATTLARAALSPRYITIEEARAAPLPRLQAALFGHDGAPLGTIAVYDPPRGGFRQSDQPVLHQLAQSAAIAIEKARLFKAAQDAARMRDDVLAIVSHDLRSPLNTIAMSAGVLRDRTRGEERALVDRIGRSVTWMNRMISDLLDASSIDAGKLAVAPRREPAPAIVREAIDNALPIAAARGCRVACGAIDESAVVVADRQRVLQVLSNLVGNAIKFSPPEETVTVGVERDGAFARFCVDDRGPGIAPEHMDRLFNRYYKAHAGSRDGTGLGLFIARGIVEAHGGRIRVESKPDRGTTVVFSIPLELS